MTHGYMLTYNLDKVYSETLRDVMGYGTTYRIKRIFTLNIARKCLNIHFWIHNLDTFIQKLVCKYYLLAIFWRSVSIVF